MTVSLLWIEVWNFFAVKHARVEYDGKGLVVIKGPNGCGKTTMFIEAPRYLIYGTTFAYGDNPGAAVMHRRATYMKVEGQVKAGDKIWTITRERHGKSMKVTLKENGIDVSPGVDVQAKIDMAMCGITDRTFCNTTVFSTALLRFPSFPDTEKKRILDEILETHGFDTALERAKKRLSEATQRLSIVSEKREMLAENIDETRTQLNRVKATLQVQDTEDPDALLSEQSSLQNKRMEREQKVNTLDVQISDGEGKLQKIIDPLSSRIVQIDTEVKNIDKQLKHQKGLIDAGKCPECGQSTRDLPSEPSDGLSDQKKKLLEERTTVNARLESAQSRLKQFDASKESLRKGRKQLQTMAQDIQSLSAKIRTAQAASKTHTDAQGRISELTASIERYTNTLTELETELEAATMAQQDAETLRDCFGPRGARIGLYETVLPFMNSEARRIAEIMNSDILTSFHVNSDSESHAGKLVVTADNPNGSSVYNGNSAGEKRRIDLVCLFAMMCLSIARSSVIFSQAFFDEAFEKLDDAAQEDFVRVIKTLVKDKTSIFIISHVSHRLEAKADLVIDMAAVRRESDAYQEPQKSKKAST